MLRITIRECEGAQTIKLEGKIAGPWVEEFRRAWYSYAPSLVSRNLRLDLRDVVFVDKRGVQLLREIYRETKPLILADSPLTKYFADEATQQSPKDGEEGV